MTRIIAGKARGRRLAGPKGSNTRPTSDRVREALFSSLTSALGSLEGLRFLDLYAGTGAVGLEAWSRGAGVVGFVESDRSAAALIAANAKAIGFQRPQLHTATVGRVLDTPPGAPFDVVFADPPYDVPSADVDAVLDALIGHGWVSEGGLVIVERSVRVPAPLWPVGLEPTSTKKYGETVLHTATTA
ncbi:MAG: 16S rRNA (guanine(966)-N(2))-methyltransferase RsmD [Nocardioides sp.]